MDFVISIVKSDLWGIIHTGRYLLSGLFLFAVFVHFLGILAHQTSWSSLLMRLVIGFILLQNYVWIMDTTKDIVVGLDKTITPQQDFSKQYAEMSENLRVEYEQNVQQSITERILNFGKNTIHSLVVNFSFIFYAIVSRIMEAIRYSIAGILYKLGPILIPLILFNSTKRVLGGWFTSYICVLSWPILWHITLSIAVAISERFGITGDGIEYFVAINFAVGFVLIFSPMIITSLAAGIGAGAAASLAGAFATKTFLDRFQQAGRIGAAGVTGAVSTGIRTVQSISQAIPVNALLSERFKNIMSFAGKPKADTPGHDIKSSSKNPFDSINKAMKGKKDE